MDALRDYAESHPTKAMDVLNGVDPPAGGIPGHVLCLDNGVRVVFSIELDQPCGVCRHLSVSVAEPGQWPSPALVLGIALELGFRGSFLDGLVWRDEEEVINWVQAKDPN